MSAAPGRSQASSHRSPQGEGTPVTTAPGRSQASSHRSPQGEGTPVTTADLGTLPPLQVLRHSANLPLSDFRLAMRRLTGAVTLVATHDGQTLAGLTATAVTAFSAEPARLLACVNLKGSTFRAIAESRRMSVNLLAYRHIDLAQQFGGAPTPQSQRFEPGRWGTLATGAPVLLDALAVFDCVVDEMMVAHSHAAMIGEIKAVLLSPCPEAPLLYADGQYTTLADLGATA